MDSPVVKSFIGGSLSGTCSAVLFQPLELVKTRVQLSIDIGPRSGVLSIVSSVIETERLIGLWKGVAPSLSRCVPGVGLYFSTLHWIRTNYGSCDPGLLELLATGATARSIAVTPLLPLTVVKTRYEFINKPGYTTQYSVVLIYHCEKSGQYRYSSMSRALVIIYKTEGLRGLFCGLGPTLLRDVPSSSIYFLFFTQLKRKLPAGYIKENCPPLFNFMCGTIAGVFASTITQPADVIKTHAQLNPAMFGSIQASVSHVYQKDGVLGFWRGIVPRTMRRTLIAAMTWTIYEELMRYFGIKT